MGRTSIIQKYTLFFSKNLYFFEKWQFCRKYFEKKVDFFLVILTFFMAALDAQQNFMPTKYLFFLSISCVFVENFTKLNILSVIAID